MLVAQYGLADQKLVQDILGKKTKIQQSRQMHRTQAKV